VRSIDITAASGGPGPKLREGDRQVPEGIYEVDSLNPNSLYHVSMRLNYPNAFDRQMAQRDRRGRLGNAIMIHGSDRSIGCVAVGDAAAEDLFVIAADAGLDQVAVVIVPRDFRRTGEHASISGQPAWVHDLYADLDQKLRSLPAATRNARGDSRGGANDSLTSR
jgi:murein L,D-transpeptidase YafK